MSEDVRFAELISRVAHELRSPLTSIKGFSSTLTRRWDRFTDEQKLQFVETINNDAERMSRIVTEVLELARLEAGRLELSPVVVDLHGLATRIVDRLGGREDVERVVVDVPEGLTAYSDADRLERGLENLVENALKFSDHGAVRLTAQACADGSVEISVGDEGVGIEEERLPHVFEGPGPHGQRAAPRATGLGLYLTRRLLEAEGGSISAMSEIDVGSTFVIRLPEKGAE